MRIIGGALGGRRLKAPRGDATRPTSDRVREAMFNILGAPPPTARVLDLCAGAGTLGLEALSRGAAEAVFVEQAAAAARVLDDNIRALGLAESSRIHRQDARSALRGTALGRFHWVFLDPPYRTPLAGELLTLLGAGDHLWPGATVIAERDRRSESASAFGCLVRTDERRYGDTVVAFYRAEIEIDA